ncbi:MAG TPA: lipopolysaccharide heptosyltransferase II [Candidatus Latescibacteria bacterium]|nr:lipopolysaccharide heptosyltransferase II [Candidatus Latescibacterota bacterium]
MNVNKILIIQTAFIGDLILTTPLIRAAKRGFPKAWLSVLTIPRTAELLEGNPSVDEVLVYDKRGRDKGSRAFLKMVRGLRSGTFDLALIPHRSLRSALLPFLAGIPRRIGFDRSAGSFLFTKTIPYRMDVHQIERNLDLISALGVKINDRLPEVYPDRHDQGVVRRFLSANGISPSDRIVAIAPGSVWPTKRWLPERFAELADRLIGEQGVKVLLIGGGSDIELCSSIAAMMRFGAVLTAGKMSLRQSAALLSRSSLLLCNDSAPMHLAVAVRTPVVAIFGPTSPSFGFAPYDSNSLVIQSDLECRPCGIHGGKRCPKGHFECMKRIHPEQVLKEIAKKL